MVDETGIDGQFLIHEYTRYRRLGVILILVGIMVFGAIAAWVSSRNITSLEVDYNKLGVHLLLDDGRNRWDVDIWDEHIASANPISGAGGIAVQVIRADDLDSERWQVFMDLANEHNLTPVLRLATTFNHEAGLWSAPTPDENNSYQSWGSDYADFINGLDWHTDEKHVILLNEPNNGHEWGGQPDPVAYANFVVDVATVLREEVESIVILNAAFDLYAPNTGSQPVPDTDLYMIDANTFMDAMIAEQPEIFSLFDKWNSHVYPVGFTASPDVESYQFDFMNDALDTTTQPPDGIFNRGINGYEWELWKLEQVGVSDIPVMITEFGWRHAESTLPDSLDSGENYPDEGLMARYLDVALRGGLSPFAGTITWQPLLADDRIEAIAFFALNGIPEEWGHTNWLELDSNGDILGTYLPYRTVSAYPFE